MAFDAAKELAFRVQELALALNIPIGQDLSPLRNALGAEIKGRDYFRERYDWLVGRVLTAPREYSKEHPYGVEIIGIRGK